MLRVLILTALGVPGTLLEHCWNLLNYTFQSQTDRENYFLEENYQYCVPSAVKINSRGEYFMAVPRTNHRVPATFGVLNKDWELDPFPDWNTNLLGNDKGLRSVASFEIDLEDNV